MTLAPDFQEDDYSETYLHYVDERQQADAEGRDPEEVEFIPSSGDGDGLEDEATNPLDAEAETPKNEDHEDSGGPICKAYFVVFVFVFFIVLYLSFH